MDHEPERSFFIHDAPGGWVEVEFVHDMRAEIALSGLHEAIERAGGQPPRRLLLDVSRVGNAASKGEMMLFTEHAHGRGLRLIDRVAVLVAPGSSAHDFVEAAMHDRGYQFFRFFRSRQGAEDWLASA